MKAIDQSPHIYPNSQNMNNAFTKFNVVTLLITRVCDGAAFSKFASHWLMKDSFQPMKRVIRKAMTSSVFNMAASLFFSKQNKYR